MTGLRTIVIATSYLLVGACTSNMNNSLADHVGTANLSEFIFLLDRDFKTALDNTNDIILDRRVHVPSKHLDGHWYYMQLNTGADKKLYRQRLSQIQISDDGQHIIQKTYGFHTPEKYENIWENPDLLTNIKPEDFKTYFNSGCEQIWTRLGAENWSGKVDPKTCIVASQRRNQEIRIGSVSILTHDKYQTSETGYQMDMTYIWGSKSGELISLYPF